MTADIEMLPLHYDELPEVPADIVARMQSYARAVAEHNTAELVDDRDDLLARLDASIDHGTKLGAAQQRCIDEVLEQKAEIEALRVDVEAWKSAHGAENDACHHFQGKAREAEARAERLLAEREVIAAEAVKYADKSGRLEAEIEALRAEVVRWKSNYNAAIELKGRAFAESGRLAEALRRAEGLLRSAGIIADADLERPHSAATEIKNALCDYDQEGEK